MQEEYTHRKRRSTNNQLRAEVKGWVPKTKRSHLSTPDIPQLNPETIFQILPNASCPQTHVYPVPPIWYLFAVRHFLLSWCF